LSCRNVLQPVACDFICRYEHDYKQHQQQQHQFNQLLSIVLGKLSVLLWLASICLQSVSARLCPVLRVVGLCIHQFYCPTDNVPIHSTTHCLSRLSDWLANQQLHDL
jgi:hypothetical protein